MDKKLASLLEDIIGQSNDAVAVLDERDAIHFFNPAFLRLFGLEEVKDTLFFELFGAGEYEKKIRPKFERAWAAKCILWRLKTRLRGGRRVALDIKAMKSRSDASKLIVTFSNITIQADIEHALIESIEVNEQELFSIIDNIPVMIMAFDGNKQIKVWNKKSEEVLGFAKGEILEGTLLFQCYGTELERMSGKGKSSCIEHYEFDMSCKDGTHKSVAWDCFPLEGPVSGELFWLVGVDITRDRRNQRELVEAKKVAEDADRGKSVFLSNMSHEIRTIINAILGYAQLLDDDGRLNPQQKKWVNTILLSSGHLLDLINDILTVTKNDMNGETVHRSSFSLTQMLQSLHNIFQIRAVNNNIDWRIENTEIEEIVITTDKSKLFQVLINLIGNAIKFTQKGSVVLKMLRREESVYFEVIDTGIGIDERMQQKVFEPFIQENMLCYGGTGLGLAIAKRNIELLGGALFLESHKKRGSRFYFEIPSKPLHEMAGESLEREKESFESDFTAAYATGDEGGSEADTKLIRIDESTKEALIRHAAIGQISKVRSLIDVLDPGEFKCSLMRLSEDYNFDGIIRHVESLEN